MTKLDFKIGSIKPNNDAVLTGAIKDLASGVTNSIQAGLNTVSPSVNLTGENTLQALRKPIKTATKGKNWKKLVKSPLSIASDTTLKALSLPFRTLEGAMEYVVNNNLERTVGGVKAFTTGAVGNLISNNGNSRFKVLRGLGTGIEGTGDLIGSAIKLLPGTAGKLLKSVNDKVFRPGIKKTQGWVENQRVSESNFIEQNIGVNTDYTNGISENEGKTTTNDDSFEENKKVA